MSYYKLDEYNNKEIVKKIIKSINEAQIAADCLINTRRKNPELRNLFYNESFFELFVANKLGHIWNSETQGIDAKSTTGKLKYEYKTVKKNGSYKGRSFQFHWLSNHKIEKSRRINKFYFIWRDGHEIDMIIEVSPKFIIGRGRESLINKITQSRGHYSITAGSFLKNLMQNNLVTGRVLKFKFMYISKNITLDRRKVTPDVLNSKIKQTELKTRKKQIEALIDSYE